jgi:tetratricopeptide (TPR) repeat protein
LEKDVNESDAYSNRAAAYLMLDEPRRALTDIDAAIGLNPADATLYYNRAYVHLRMREHAKAISDYTETVRLRRLRTITATFRGVLT